MFIQLAAGLALAASAAPGTFAAHGDERLGALIERALRNNPRVLQAFADYQAALSRVPQETALPDPQVSVTQFARTIETRVGPQQRVLMLSQSIPGRGKRAAKGQLAAKSAAVWDEAYQAVRAEVVLRVKHAYYDLGYLDRAIAASQEDEGLLAHFEELSRRRYGQGFGLQGDVLRLQAQITQALYRRQQLAGQRIGLESTLNALCGLPADAPFAEVRLADLPSVRLGGQALAEIARGSRPEVRSAWLRIEEGEKLVHLARIRHRPDFTVGVTWGNIRARGAAAAGMPVLSDGKDSYGVSLGFSLPIFRRKYDAGVQEAAERLASARFAYRDSANEVESQIRSVTIRLETIQSQIHLFERTLVPQAEQALRSTEAAYSNGTVEVTGLLDILRMLLDVHLGLARLQADYHKGVADLERVIGSAVPEEVGS